MSKGSFLALLVRDQFDFAGPSNRDHIHQLVVQPFVNVRLPEGWFVTVAPEMRMDWRNENHWFIPADLLVGKMLTKTIVVSVEGKYQLRDALHLYDWEVEFRIGVFF
jgi:hypothetical protein